MFCCKVLKEQHFFFQNEESESLFWKDSFRYFESLGIYSTIARVLKIQETLIYSLGFQTAFYFSNLLLSERQQNHTSAIDINSISEREWMILENIVVTY